MTYVCARSIEWALNLYISVGFRIHRVCIVTVRCIYFDVILSTFSMLVQYRCSGYEENHPNYCDRRDVCVCVCVSPAKVECVSIRYCPIWELNQLTWCEKESEKLVTTIINAIKSHSNTHERLSAVSFIYVYIILNTYLHFIIASLVLLVSCYNTCEWCVKFDDFHHAYPIYAIYTSNKWCCWPRIWTWVAFHFTECVFV